MMTQQCAELLAVLAGVRLGWHRGWKDFWVVGDNMSSLYQAATLKASVGLVTQQRLLRKISYLVKREGLGVELGWVGTDSMPADPVSRRFEKFEGSRGLAAEAARNVFVSNLGEGGYVLPFGEVGGVRTKEEKARLLKLKLEWEGRGE